MLAYVHDRDAHCHLPLWGTVCFDRHKKRNNTMNKNYEYSYDHLIDILVARDKMDRDSAIDLVEGVKEEMLELIEEGEFNEVYDTFSLNLGLEPDYIEALIPLA